MVSWLNCVQLAVTVHDFDDKSGKTPDSVFPNNWFSTHAGACCGFSMFAETHRRERRWDVIDMLKRDYRVQDAIDYSGLERDGLALEGTGAMVLDHIGRVAYAAKSNRADPVLLERFCTISAMNEPIAFDAVDAGGNAVYHTNVLMAIGTEYALVGLDMIVDDERRKTVHDHLVESGHEVIALNEHQISEFCGNAFELAGQNGPVLAISQRALNAPTSDQIATIERSAQILPLSIPTIGTTGGSV